MLFMLTYSGLVIVINKMKQIFSISNLISNRINVNRYNLLKEKLFESSIIFLNGVSGLNSLRTAPLPHRQ